MSHLCPGQGLLQQAAHRLPTQPHTLPQAPVPTLGAGTPLLEIRVWELTMPARELVLQNFLGCQCLDWTEAKRTQGRSQSLALPSGSKTPTSQLQKPGLARNLHDRFLGRYNNDNNNLAIRSASTGQTCIPGLR